MDIRKKVASSTTNLPNDKGKDMNFHSQYQLVYQSFKEKPKTMLDVFIETGILRANICRYVAGMKEKGIIQLLYKKDDKHTKSKAGYYTTDKTLFHKVDNKQYNTQEVE